MVKILARRFARSQKIAKKPLGAHHLYALETRHIESAGKKTTLALERAFWRALENRAAKVGQDWQKWTATALIDRPASIGKARWLRVHLLDKVSI
jgi:predicted DNA-binding ribbon-helix-helix protein